MGNICCTKEASTQTTDPEPKVREEDIENLYIQEHSLSNVSSLDWSYRHKEGIYFGEDRIEEVDQIPLRFQFREGGKGMESILTFRSTVLNPTSTVLCPTTVMYPRHVHLEELQNPPAFGLPLIYGGNYEEVTQPLDNFEGVDIPTKYYETLTSTCSSKGERDNENGNLGEMNNSNSIARQATESLNSLQFNNISSKRNISLTSLEVMNNNTNSIIVDTSFKCICSSN